MESLKIEWDRLSKEDCEAEAAVRNITGENLSAIRKNLKDALELEAQKEAEPPPLLTDPEQIDAELKVIVDRAVELREAIKLCCSNKNATEARKIKTLIAWLGLRLKRVTIYDEATAKRHDSLVTYFEQCVDWLKKGVPDEPEPKVVLEKEKLDQSFSLLDQLSNDPLLEDNLDQVQPAGNANTQKSPNVDFPSNQSMFPFCYVPMSFNQTTRNFTPVDAQNSAQFMPFSQPVRSNVRVIYTKDWKLQFTGEPSSKLSLAVFLRDVGLKRQESNLSGTEFWASAHNLFDGQAKTWFLNNRHKWNSWAEFVPHFICNFRPPNYEERLWEQLRQRRQGRDERLNIYCSEMENSFALLGNPPSEQERLSFIKARLAPFWLLNLPLDRIYSIDSLVAEGLRLEAVKCLVDEYTDPTAPSNPVEKDLVYISINDGKKGAGGPSKTCVAGICCGAASTGSFCCAARAAGVQSASGNSQATNTVPPQQNSNRGKGNWRNYSRGGRQAHGAHTNNQNTSAPSQTNNASAAKMCWNCFQQGHSFRQCSQPKRGLFCWGCGKDGVARANCSKESCRRAKNSRGAAASGASRGTPKTNQTVPQSAGSGTSTN
ncbi:uncharacterized protein LOC132195851 [Neocloeon triangulifer]|uniref:uncharacterized protein LOC132195851 n=1 Tax=Neocloeon triangulifer TaxID=2078957 RepID=UPI00286EF97A|nr:uncharacterized protein LOC132195851 [Neocloeon triangulifer]